MEVLLAGQHSTLSCSDSDMDGPEDCGKPQGDGKSKDSNGGFINEWELDGLTSGKGGSFTCTPETDIPVGGQDACVLTPNDPPNCYRPVEKPDSITWRYTGGTCAASTNDDEGRYTDDKGKIKVHKDFKCAGEVNPNLPINVSYEKGSFNNIQPGGEFTTPRDQIKRMSLSNSGGQQEMEFHTSCSQPFEVGMTAGALTLVALDGNRGSSEVTYIYTVQNTGLVEAVDITVVDDKLGLIGEVNSLPPNESKTFMITVPIVDDTTNIVTVTGETIGSGTVCEAEDSVTVTVP